MSKDMLDTLGELIIEAVRDRQIDSWNILFKEKRVLPFLEKYMDALNTLTPEQQEFLGEVGIQTVDAVIHNLLLILDDNWITIKLVDEAGIEYDLKKLAKGSLQGYIFMWAEKYSKYPSK